MKQNMEQYPELRKFILGRSENCHLVTIVRPGQSHRSSIFKARVFLSDEDADYIILRFGVKLRLRNET